MKEKSQSIYDIRIFMCVRSFFLLLLFLILSYAIATKPFKVGFSSSKKIVLFASIQAL